MQLIKARKKIGPVNLPFNRPIRPILKRLRCGFRCGRIGPVNGGIAAKTQTATRGVRWGGKAYRRSSRDFPDDLEAGILWLASSIAASNLSLCHKSTIESVWNGLIVSMILTRQPALGASKRVV